MLVCSLHFNQCVMVWDGILDSFNMAIFCFFMGHPSNYRLLTGTKVASLVVAVLEWDDYRPVREEHSYH